jgi:hypothetical protein
MKPSSKLDGRLYAHLLVLVISLSTWGLAASRRDSTTTYGAGSDLNALVSLAALLSWIAAISVIVMVVVNTVAYLREQWRRMHSEKAGEESAQVSQKAVLKTT